jgi:hypothetical protein
VDYSKTYPLNRWLDIRGFMVISRESMDNILVTEERSIVDSGFMCSFEGSLSPAHIDLIRSKISICTRRRHSWNACTSSSEKYSSGTVH